MITVKDLKPILNSLDDFVEVQIQNHHLESKEIKKTKVQLKDAGQKKQKLVLTLFEESI